MDYLQYYNQFNRKAAKHDSEDLDKFYDSELRNILDSCHYTTNATLVYRGIKSPQLTMQISWEET